MKSMKKVVFFAASFLVTLTLCSATALAADYKVSLNDSLYKIGQLFNTPVDTIKADNYLTSDQIHTGQILYVPAKIYTVQSGDTMFLIAQRYGISLASLRKANNKYDDNLIPGNKLILPGVNPAGGSQTVIPYTNNEVDLLARLITAEAGGESYKAMVGVGAVVINRVQSHEWAPTINDVIYQKYGDFYQFTPVKNGYINKPATDEALRAAWAALYGSDPSNGAIYYFDESSKNQWLWSKTETAHIDKLVFVK